MATFNFRGPKEKYNVLFWVLVGCTILTVVVTVWMMYRMASAPSSSPAALSVTNIAPVKPKDTFVDGSSDIVYVYSSRCGWCERFNPVWADFAGRYDGKLRLLKVEAGDPEASKYHVTGYPTVMFVKNGVQSDLFKEERTVENLMKWAKSHE